MRTRIRGNSAGILLICTLLLPVYCGVALGWDVTDAEMRAYVAALEDSRAATQEKVFKGLIAVVPGRDAVNAARLCGGGLVWEGEPGQSRVLVAAFMDRSTYETYYRQSIDERAKRYLLRKSLWVTLVPELQNAFMRGCARDWPPKLDRCPPTPKRVARLLGLPPNKDYEILVELWVNPQDLFRPSADPEITDHEAEPAVKNEDGSWSFRSDQNPFSRIDESRLFLDRMGGTPVPFKTWYAELAERYDPHRWDAPWTRLGYTYDWGNPRNHVGVTELIVRVDPDPAKQYVEVRLKRAIDAATAGWKQYFRCRSQGLPRAAMEPASCR